MGDTFRYKAFISYSHADERWGTWLHRALERYRVPSYLATKHRLPKAPLRPVFRDREELASSSSLSESIETALEASENLIVVCSPAAAESKWVNEEIEAFERLERGDRIFCLIVDGSDDDCFPEALAGREPLAADIREGADSRQDAKLRLISGLLNIQFGELKNREQRRRNRVLGASLGASLVVAGVMTILAVLAVAASTESERQRLIAEKALADAKAATEFLSNLIEDVKAKDVGYTIADNLRAQSDLWGEETIMPRDFVRNVNNFAAAQAVLVGHILEPAFGKASDVLADQPLAEARILETIARGYDSIVNCDKAVEVQNSAVTLFAQEMGESAEQTLKSRLRLADYYECAGARETGHEIRLAVAGQSESARGAEALVTLEAKQDLGFSFLTLTGGVAHTRFDQPPVRPVCDDGACERYARGHAYLEDSFRGFDRTLGRRDERTLRAMSAYAWGRFLVEEQEEAKQTALEALKLQTDLLGPDHLDTRATVYSLAKMHLVLGELTEAEQYFNGQLESARREYGAGHPVILDILFDIVDTMLKDGRSDDRRDADVLNILAEARTIFRTTQSDDANREFDELVRMANDDDLPWWRVKAKLLEVWKYLP